MRSFGHLNLASGHISCGGKSKESGGETSESGNTSGEPGYSEIWKSESVELFDCRTSSSTGTCIFGSGESSIHFLSASQESKIWMGVFRFSFPLPPCSYLGLCHIILERTLVCKAAAENGNLVARYSSSYMRLLVNECSPIRGALLSKPHAAMTSITTPLLVESTELPAAQQSRRIRTSDFDSAS